MDTIATLFGKAKETLKPKLREINAGYYPEQELRAFGKLGAFDSIYRLGEQGLLESILKIDAMSSVCGTTGFCAWCQCALAWYIFNTQNTQLQNALAEKVASGALLGGTGLSNPMKSYSQIEKNLLKAKRVDGGYVVNGVLPWVSNIQKDSYFGAIVDLEDRAWNVIGVIACTKDCLRESVHFGALEGSSTHAVYLKNYFLSDDWVLSHCAEKYLLEIAPGFVLLQAGIASGLIKRSASIIKKGEQTKEVNAYLPLSSAQIETQLQALLENLQKLLKTPYATQEKDYMKQVLTLRLRASELTLDAARSAMLCAGTQGLVEASVPAKNLLESYFVAIVTPAMKHLRKELHRMEKGEGSVKSWLQASAQYESSAK